MANLSQLADGVTPWGDFFRALWRVAHNDDGTLRNYAINVKDYGAVGDGSTDDTAAINSAISAAANKELYFPGGTYKSSGGHILSSPITIRGAGRGTIGAANGVTTFSLANGANADMFRIASKVVNLTQFGIYGNKGNQTTTSRGIVFDATAALAYNSLSDLWVDSFRDTNILVATSGSSVSETLLQHVESRNSGGRGVEIATGANDVTLSQCQLAQNDLSGIYFNASGKILDCHSWGNGLLNTTGDYSGASVFGSVQIIGGQYETNGSVAGAGRGIDIRGVGNSVTGADVYLNKGNGIYAFRNTAFTMGLVIASNRCYSNSVNGGGSGIVLDTLNGAVVTGNHCYDPATPKTQVYGIQEVNNPDYVTYSANVSRTADHKTAGWSLGTGSHNVPVAASIGTLNVV